jgi:hypothetical protein
MQSERTKTEVAANHDQKPIQIQIEQAKDSFLTELITTDMVVAQSGKHSNQKTLLIMIKETIFKATRDTTGHGIPRILESKNNFIRFLWLAAVLCSVGACAYMLYDGTSHYFSWNVVTTIKVIGESPSLFPVVTICPLNPISTNESIAFSKQTFNNTPLVYVANSGKSYYALRYFVTLSATNPIYNDSVRQNFGGSLSDTVLSCSFNQVTCNMSNFRV